MESEELEGMYIDYAKQIMDDEWINEQLRLVDEVSQFKEKGSFWGLFHPFITSYLNVRVTIRRASILNEETILMGVGHSNIVELGRNLYELQGFYDKERMRSRLQSGEFEDACWELEVMVALIYSGIHASFEKEKETKSFDMTALIGSDKISIECKNKHIKDKAYTSNQLFSNVLGEKIINYLEKLGGMHDISIAIDGAGKVEDIKQLVQTIRLMLESNITYKKFKDTYKIKLTNKYRGIPTGIIMKSYNEEFCINSSHINSLEQVYLQPTSGVDYKDRVFLKFTPQDLSLKNLNSLLSKANKQLSSTQGCVFLKVPYHAFNESVIEVEGLLQRFYSNVSGVKLIALNKNFFKDRGVEIGRQEKFIVNEHAKIQLAQVPKTLFERPMMFNKYV